MDLTLTRDLTHPPNIRRVPPLLIGEGNTFETPLSCKERVVAAGDRVRSMF